MLKLDLTTLRPWLLSHLEPICDADPAVLSEYILALLKHDNTIDQLKQLCQEQLEDFLGSETPSFITRLFFFLTTPPALASLRAETSPPSRGTKRHAEPATTHPSAPSSKRLPSQSRPGAQASAFAPGEGPSAHTAASPAPQWASPGPVRRGDATLPPPPRELCKDYHYRGFCARGAGCPFQHDDDASAAFPPPPFVPSFPSLPLPPQYNRPPHGGPPPFFAPPFPPAPSGPPRRGFGHASAREHDGRPLSTTTLAIENVPREALSSANVRQFFVKFGPVKSVAVDPPGLRALVTFASPDDAKRALSSPEAIFGNRFVRVYRAREALQPLASTSSSTSAPQPPSSPQASNASTTPRLPTSAASATRAVPPRTDEHATDAATRALQLQNNASAQKALMEQLDGLPPGSTSQKQRSSIMAALRDLSREATSLAASTAADRALDPQERLRLLQQEAAALGIDTNAPAPTAARGRGGFRGGRATFGARGRGGAPRTFRLDNRTTKVLVGDVASSTGLSTLRAYFERFGEVLLLNPTSDSTEYIIEFKTRQSAEEALSKGSEIPEVGRVSLRWATGSAIPGTRSTVEPEDSPMSEASAVQGGSAGEQATPNSALEVRGPAGEDEDTERSWNR